MSLLILFVILIGCYATSGPGVCITQALQSQCGGDGCPVSLAPNQHMTIFFNYSSILLNYTFAGTSQDWVKTILMDRKNYQLYLAGQQYTYSFPGSDLYGGMEGTCKTDILENTKGLGSVLILMCVYSSPANSTCNVWYNHSFTVIADRCTPNCLIGMVGNGVCDGLCDSAACGYDGGDCPIPTTNPTATCAPGCYLDMLGDNACDPECNNAQCNYDDGDCPVNTNPSPSPISESHTRPSPTTIATFQITPKSNSASVLSIF